jgi:hypothetical protein
MKSHWSARQSRSAACLLGRMWRAALLFFVCVSLASTARAYRTLADVEGTDERIAWAQAPGVVFDPAGVADGDLVDFRVDLAAAVELWNAVECGPHLLHYAGLSTEAQAPIVVRFAPDWASAVSPPMFPRRPRSRSRCIPMAGARSRAL